MPSLDAYLGLQLDDEDGISDWMLAHRARHHAYAQAAGSAGTQVQTYDFGASTNPPDDDWFQRHYIAHTALQPFMAPDPGVSLTILAQNMWDNEDDFATWMQAHNRIHQLLDQGFRLF
jgi:hypothetical protein